MTLRRCTTSIRVITGSRLHAFETNNDSSDVNDYLKDLDVVENNDTVHMDNTSSNSNVVSSSSSSFFNPFQYDATSVRLNSDRIRTMSTVQPPPTMNDTTTTTTTTTSTGITSDTRTTFIAASTSATTTTSSSPWKSNTNTNNYNRISLRSITMKQIMNEMINTVPDYDKVRDILQRNKDFLLEILEDDWAVPDDNHNNIYQNCTNRMERYEAFQRNMNERILMAQNPSVQQILKIYTDFILSHQ
jgi:hypothetical protein